MKKVVLGVLILAGLSGPIFAEPLVESNVHFNIKVERKSQGPQPNAYVYVVVYGPNYSPYLYKTGLTDRNGKIKLDFDFPKGIDGTYMIYATGSSGYYYYYGDSITQTGSLKVIKKPITINANMSLPKMSWIGYWWGYYGYYFKSGAGLPGL